MSIVPPTAPIIPDVVQYSRPGSIINNITPFTYRDGITYLEFLESLSSYLSGTVVPFMDESFDVLESKWADDMMEVVVAVNAALASQATTVNTALTTQQNAVNDALAENAADMAALTDLVNETVTSLTTYVNTKTTESKDYVDDAVSALTTTINSTAFQDANVKNLIVTAGTQTRTALDARYALIGSGGGGGGVTDEDVNSLIADTDSYTRGTLDSLYMSVDADPEDYRRRAKLYLAAALANYRKPHGAVVGALGLASVKPAGAAFVDPNMQGFGPYLRDVFQTAVGGESKFEPDVLVDIDDGFRMPGVRVVNYGNPAGTVGAYTPANLATDVTNTLPQVFVHFTCFEAMATNTSPAAWLFGITTAINAIQTAAANSDYNPVHIIVAGVFPSGGSYTYSKWDYETALDEMVEWEDHMIKVSPMQTWDWNFANNNSLGLTNTAKNAIAEPGYNFIARAIAQTCALEPVGNPRQFIAWDSGIRPLQSSNLTLNARKLPSGQTWSAPATFDANGWGIGGAIQGPSAGTNSLVGFEWIDAGFRTAEFSACVSTMPASATAIPGIWVSNETDTTGLYRVAIERNTASAANWDVNTYENGVKTTRATIARPGSATANIWLKLVVTSTSIEAWINGEKLYAGPNPGGRTVARGGLYYLPAATAVSAFFRNVSVKPVTI